VPGVVLVERAKAVEAHVVEGVEHHDGDEHKHDVDQGARADAAPVRGAGGGRSARASTTPQSSVRSSRTWSRLTTATATNRVTPAVEASPKSRSRTLFVDEELERCRPVPRSPACHHEDEAEERREGGDQA